MFNLELDEYEPLREQLKFWKGQLASTAQAPPLIIDILLDISSMTPAEHLILDSLGSGHKTRISSKQLIGIDSAGRPVRKQKILLETWQLSLSPVIPHTSPDIPLVYKKSIVFFRSLYSIVRLLPCYQLTRALGRHKSKCGEITYRISTTRVISPDVAGLDELHAETDMRRGISEVRFEPLETPLGVFNLHSTYRLDCNFGTEMTEYALSGRFNDYESNVASKDEGDSTSGTKDSTTSSRMQHLSFEIEPKKPNLGVQIPGNLPIGRNIPPFQNVQFRVETLPRSSHKGNKEAISAVSGPFTPTSNPPCSLPVSSQIMGPFAQQGAPFMIEPSEKKDLFSPLPTEIDLPFAKISGSPPFSDQEKMIRRPSYTFSTQQNHGMNQVATQFFSLSSSLITPSYGVSPPAIMYDSTAYHVNDIKAFMNTIESSIATPPVLNGKRDFKSFRQVLTQNKIFSENLSALVGQKKLAAPFPAVSEQQKKRVIKGQEEDELLFNMSELDL